MRKIRIDVADVKANISGKRILKEVIWGIFADNKRELESLQYVLCSDDYLLGINQQFLNHDTYTDIITFPLSEPGELIVGEIYISVDRVRDNAAKFKTTVLEELYRVFFHGALHLCGFKDKTAAAKAEMRRQEDVYLRKIKNSST